MSFTALNGSTFKRFRRVGSLISVWAIGEAEPVFYFFSRCDLARDLQAFLVFSQHPAGVYCAGKPLESVVYCLITFK